MPFESIGAIERAGGVNVIYGFLGGLTARNAQFWSQGSPAVPEDPEVADLLGWSLAAGDYDADGFDDLSIGVPFEDVGSRGQAGAVNVLYGDLLGLASAGADVWTQNTPGVLEVSEQDDQFGWALAAGDFDGDVSADLAIGAPFEDVGGVNAPGAVNVLYGNAGGLAAAGNQLWHQGRGGVSGAPGTQEQLGFSVRAVDFDGDGRSDLAIGVPFQVVAGAVGAGGAHVLYGAAGGLAAAGNEFWSQASPGILDEPEAGDVMGQEM